MATPQPPPMPPGGYQQPQRTSGLAIAGFICAFVCSLLGLILSILGLNEINRSNGQVKGKGLAIAGIVVSILVAVVGVLGAVAIPAFMDYMKKSKGSHHKEPMSQLDQIQKNAKTYFIEQAKFPVGDVPLTPSGSCCMVGQNSGFKCPAWGATERAAWSVLDFTQDEPHYFQYAWKGDGNTLDVDAVGDLDCDMTTITYRLHMDSHDGNPSGSISEPPPNAD